MNIGELKSWEKQLCNIGDHLENNRINSACLDVGALHSKVKTILEFYIRIEKETRDPETVYDEMKRQMYFNNKGI